jgi:spore germination cell wall hydrolase CwlJ-like protein
MTALMCLAVAVYFEARGEPIDGQMAVAEVVMNRVEDERYPDTVCAVVYDRSSFSFTQDSKPDRLPKKSTEAKRRAMQVASNVLHGSRVGITSTHYHTVSVDPFWSSHYDYDGIIGHHMFYTNNTEYR